jgi:hypothetical protein
VAVISQSFRSNSENIEVDSLFSQLLDESRRLKSKESKETALTVKVKPGKKNGGRPKCVYCKKNGHEEAKCWLKSPEKRPKRSNSEDKKS